MELLSSVLEFIKTVAIIVIIAFFVRFFLIQPYFVEGSSMEPSFHNGEYLLVNKLVYRLNQPQRGDVVIFRPPPDPSVNYIKRIIGLPGDTVEIKDGAVYVNDQKLPEPYLGGDNVKTLAVEANLKEKVGPSQYFVLGDNRDHSKDSREFGVVPMINIIGRAWLVVYPSENFGIVNHPRYTNISLPVLISPLG